MIHTCPAGPVTSPLRGVLGTLIFGSAEKPGGWATRCALLAAAGCVLAAGTAFAQTPPNRAALFATLPAAYNTTDDMALAPNGEVIISVPNFNNYVLQQRGTIREPSPAVFAAISPEGKVREWYRFKPEDLHPATGKVGPHGVEFGPDGHLYFIDRQYDYDHNYRTRLARLLVTDGRPTRMEVLVEGSIGANDLMWRGDTLYVTESVAKNPASKSEKLASGVYAFPLAELNRGTPVHLLPYRDERDHDPHQVVTFQSSNKMGSGADGLAFDAEGNLYTNVIEEGAIYRTVIDAGGKVGATTLFARDPSAMVSADGLTFDPKRRRFYVADFLGNAVHAVTMEGKVTTLQKNGDTDASHGQLDQPCATLVVGDRLIVSNMDYAAANPGLSVNTRVDEVHALSAIPLD